MTGNVLPIHFNLLCTIQETQAKNQVLKVFKYFLNPVIKSLEPKDSFMTLESFRTFNKPVASFGSTVFLSASRDFFFLSKEHLV